MHDLCYNSHQSVGIVQYSGNFGLFLLFFLQILCSDFVAASILFQFPLSVWHSWHSSISKRVQVCSFVRLIYIAESQVLQSAVSLSTYFCLFRGKKSPHQIGNNLWSEFRYFSVLLGKAVAAVIERERGEDR